ncbi:UNVERIFIED_CONTAM: ypt2 [Trichonephila clavipes]
MTWVFIYIINFPLVVYLNDFIHFLIDFNDFCLFLGIDFKQKIVNLDGMPIKLQIWDTAGQERFRTLTTAYYRGAMGILVMYDVTNMDSFNHLSYWFRNVEENASPDVVKVLVGNKCDSSNLRVVEPDQGRKVAESCDVPFFECSCKDNVNIDEIFLTVARMIREQRERRVMIFQSVLLFGLYIPP